MPKIFKIAPKLISPRSVYKIALFKLFVPTIGDSENDHLRTG